jgi:hypothetical protein
MGGDATGLQRHPQPYEASMDRLHIDQQRQPQGPVPSARPYCPAATNPQELVSPAKSPAANRGWRQKTPLSRMWLQVRMPSWAEAAPKAAER